MNLSFKISIISLIKDKIPNDFFIWDYCPFPRSLHLSLPIAHYFWHCSIKQKLGSSSSLSSVREKDSPGKVFVNIHVLHFNFILNTHCNQLVNLPSPFSNISMFLTDYKTLSNLSIKFYFLLVFSKLIEFLCAMYTLHYNNAFNLPNSPMIRYYYYLHFRDEKVTSPVSSQANEWKSWDLR